MMKNRKENGIISSQIDRNVMDLPGLVVSVPTGRKASRKPHALNASITQLELDFRGRKVLALDNRLRSVWVNEDQIDSLPDKDFSNFKKGFLRLGSCKGFLDDCK